MSCLVPFSGYISSPNYPNVYPDKLNANWTLTATSPTNAKVTLVITDMSIECDCNRCSIVSKCLDFCDSLCSQCRYDYIKVVLYNRPELLIDHSHSSLRWIL